MGCKHSHVEFFKKCGECGKTAFPLETKPNYFKLFGIPLAYFIDLEKLEKRFYELTRLLHPDKYQTQSPEELVDATQWSAYLNDAYRTLKSSDERAEYIFDLASFKKDSGK